MRNTHRTRVLVLHNNTLLVVKHWLGRDFWQLPGGGLHTGEDVLVGAARELLEETDISVKPAMLQHIGTDRNMRNRIPIHLEYVVLHLKQKPKIRVQKTEIREYAWLDLTDEQLLISRSTYDALQYLKR